MKVLNLQCAHQHSFEGWFGSEDDFQSQLMRGLIECPFCTDSHITKMPTAPRLNLGGYPAPNKSDEKTAQPASAVNPDLSHDSKTSLSLVADQSAAGPEVSVTEQQGLFLKALLHVMANTENVGQRFAEEARRMHYGDAEQRSIRGQTSAQEVVELLDEGIEVMALPLPAALKETLQ